jgi:hypothetical protein
MTELTDLLKEYIEEHQAGGEADPVAYLERVSGEERPRLEAMIDSYLRRAPRREWDPTAYERSPAPRLVESLGRSLAGQAGLWPSLLPRLRNQARIKRSDLVAQLADRLGAGSKRDKVADYYNRMEQGRLPASGVSDDVLEALGKIVGQTKEGLRRAGAAVAPGEPPGDELPAMTRVTRGAEEAERRAPAGPAPGEEWDEVDRLFRGG